MICPGASRHDLKTYTPAPERIRTMATHMVVLAHACCAGARAGAGLCWPGLSAMSSDVASPVPEFEYFCGCSRSVREGQLGSAPCRSRRRRQEAETLVVT